jgi:hypothetical protein
MLLRLRPMFRCLMDLFLLTAVTTDARSTSISEVKGILFKAQLSVHGNRKLNLICWPLHLFTSGSMVCRTERHRIPVLRWQRLNSSCYQSAHVCCHKSPTEINPQGTEDDIVTWKWPLLYAEAVILKIMTYIEKVWNNKCAEWTMSKTLVKALCHKPQGRGSDSRWGH